jgi:hypothetical protein
MRGRMPPVMRVRVRDAPSWRDAMRRTRRGCSPASSQSGNAGSPSGRQPCSSSPHRSCLSPRAAPGASRPGSAAGRASAGAEAPGSAPPAAEAGCVGRVSSTVWSRMVNTSPPAPPAAVTGAAARSGRGPSWGGRRRLCSAAATGSASAGGVGCGAWGWARHRQAGRREGARVQGAHCKRLPNTQVCKA